MDRRTCTALIAVLAALAVAVPALAAQGGGSGGTPTQPPPEVGPSGGVAGPGEQAPAKRGAHAAQDPEEEPPQVEQPTETTPTETEPETTPETAPEETAPGAETEQAPSSGAAPTTGGGGGGGLPSTGLELASMAAVGAGLLLAGWALRRRPTQG